jgi:hypothetical protein
MREDGCLCRRHATNIDAERRGRASRTKSPSIARHKIQLTTRRE